MRNFLNCFCLLVLFSPLSAFATSSIADLDWLAGQWKAPGMEISFTGPDGGLILGNMKVTANSTTGGAVTFYELDQITVQNGDVVLQPMPFGRPGVLFAATTLQSGQAIFENPQHDFPAKIIYRVSADGHLHCQIEGAQGGQTIRQNFEFSKVQ